MTAGRSLSVLTALVVLAGCATQGPYQRPVTNLPVAWTNAASTDGAKSPGDVNRPDWWVGLHDPAIDALVTAALSDNPTLDEAAARVDQAKAAFSIERAQRSPRVDLAASAERARMPATGAQPSDTSTAWQSTAAIGSSLSWEIDLWGRVKQATLAARSRLQARNADAAEARLSIAAQVSDNVLGLRACDLLLDVRDADILSRQQELTIIRARVRLGSVAPVDIAAAESNLAAVRIDRISQEQVCRQTVDALVALSGRAAAEVRSIMAGPLAADGRYAAVPTGELSAGMPSAPPVIPGLPGTVLLAHPSVVAAEREVAARWSEIAVARAERLPRLDLTALLTGQWISALGSTASFVTGSIGAGASAPLIDGGAGQAEVVRADARYREAVATLNVTLRQAVRDIEDGLSAQDSAVRRVEASRSALSAARLTLRGNEARRRVGSIGAFELEDSRRQLNRAQESAIIAARDRAQSWVELIRRSGSIADTDHVLGSTTPASPASSDAGVRVANLGPAKRR